MRVDQINRAILILRGHRVPLDSDLAALYGAEAKALNQAVRRKAERFPADFMFRLTLAEVRSLNVRATPPTAELSGITGVSDLRSQSVTSSGGRRYLPYAFTEQGVAMLSSVLRSSRAVQVNIKIIRASSLRSSMLSSRSTIRNSASCSKATWARRRCFATSGRWGARA